jgi:hypothetical protein
MNKVVRDGSAREKELDDEVQNEGSEDLTVSCSMSGPSHLSRC